MMYSLFAVFCVLFALFFDMNSAGSSYGISSSQRSRIISQHAGARRKAFYGQTKLPAAKASMRSSYSINLAWSSSLASSAQRWANTCTFGHSSSGNGENIYWNSGTPSASSATAATPAWLSELSYYSWSTTGSGLRCQAGKMCGHYTQAIWGNTKRIGCAVSNCASKPVRGIYKTMVVCQYSPPGNYIGQYPYTRSDSVPFGEVNIDPQPAQSLIGLNIIVFALVAMMIINITCLIATASKRCSKDGNFVSYQSVQTKEIEV